MKSLMGALVLVAVQLAACGGEYSQPLVGPYKLVRYNDLQVGLADNSHNELACRRLGEGVGGVCVVGATICVEVVRYESGAHVCWIIIDAKSNAVEYHESREDYLSGLKAHGIDKEPILTPPA